MPATRVLNVNDNEISRFTITRVLQQEGFEVVEAVAGLPAIEIALNTPLDLIFLDIRLPDIDGYEVCRRLRLNPATRRIPIIHITAHALATENRIQSLDLGADAYLTIPVERAYLSAVANSLLRLRRAELEQDRLLLESERERAQLKTALEELKIERGLREQFVATLTHDLRTPITAIRMTTDLIKRQTQDPAIAQKMGRVSEQVMKMDRMIQDLLDVTMLRAGRPLPVRRNPVDLCELTRSALVDFAPAARVRTECSQPVVGNFDAHAIVRVVDNLVQNALKYGAVDSPVSVRVKDEATRAIIEVHNEGNPIPADRIDGIFDAYNRTESARRSEKVGWGLGLTLVKGVVDAHGGEIKVVSSDETGTTFSVFLPKLPSPITL